MNTIDLKRPFNHFHTEHSREPLESCLHGGALETEIMGELVKGIAKNPALRHTTTIDDLIRRIKEDHGPTVAECLIQRQIRINELVDELISCHTYIAQIESKLEKPQ
jgi:hypothetical protein